MEASNLYTIDVGDRLISLKCVYKKTLFPNTSENDCFTEVLEVIKYLLVYFSNFFFLF